MVEDLGVGQPVGTLGFPGELGAFGGAADNTITSTFKDGVLSALRLIDTGEEPHVEVQFNVDATGGTGSSPVVDHNGWVIALNHAGPEVRVMDIEGNTVRIALGSLDKGIRVDEAWDLIDHLGSAPARMAGLRSAPRPFYPSDAYQPYPEKWNGETVHGP